MWAVVSLESEGSIGFLGVKCGTVPELVDQLIWTNPSAED